LEKNKTGRILMGNILNFNFNKLDLKLSNSDYWDFFLVSDEYNTCGYTPQFSGDCFVVWYDFNNPATFANSQMSATSIYSLVSWSKAVNTGYTLDAFGITGIDNGFLTFNKESGDTKNEALLSVLTGSTLIIPSGETRLRLNRVTGTTGNYIYPIEILNDTTGYYTQYCGGFHQGYYKIDGTTYEALPTRVNQAWAAEFWLLPQDFCTGHTGTTLNDDFPDNKGIFFYMGTRAENKFWNIFSGVSTGCTSGCTIPSGCTEPLNPWCTVTKENEVSIINDDGILIPLDPPQLQIDLITNPFLIYGRANSKPYPTVSGNPEPNDVFFYVNSVSSTDDEPCTCNNCHKCYTKGFGLGSKKAHDYDGKGLFVVKKDTEISNTQNPFLIYGRASGNVSGCKCNACSGSGDGLGSETVCSFTGFTKDKLELDYNTDIIDNALAFRIKDDGSIGYRLLTYTGTCITSATGSTYVSGVTVEEAYSLSGMVSANTWSYIVIRFVTNYLDDCELAIKKPRKGKLMFYVNAKLKFVVNEFDEIVARRLNEYYSKQIGVPFNISLGGGSQGLLESQTFDGLDMADRDLPIEKNFAGTFIGGISQFKFNICDLNYNDIQNTYIYEKERYSGVVIIPNKPAPSHIYYGKFNGTSITSAETISNLTLKYTESVVNTYVTVPAVNGYGYVLIPSTLTQPSDFRNSLYGCTGFNIPYVVLQDIIIVDSNGFSITYKVYRTFNTTFGSLNMWMCD